MKWSLACFLMCLPLVAVHGQQERKQAEKVVRNMARAYDLDASQKEAIRVIQLEYFNNFKEIEDLEQYDYLAYLKKCRNIRRGMESMVLKVLDSQQRLEFSKDLAEKKALLEKERHSMLEQGKSKEEIRLWELESFKPIQ